MERRGFCSGLASHQNSLRAVLAFAVSAVASIGSWEWGRTASDSSAGVQAALGREAASSRATPQGCKYSQKTQNNLNQSPKTSSLVPA